jgi:hypothetical protein
MSTAGKRRPTIAGLNGIELSEIEGGPPTPRDEVPRTYLEWNDALASRILRPEMAGREVFLFVNDDLIEEIGGAESVREFVTEVERGPPWVDSGRGLCQKALQALDNWRARELRFPPYIGYLCLFVLAVGGEGDFPAYAYYPRLRRLLGWPDVHAGAPPSFDRMLLLWEDLEVWSNQDMDGALGIFSIRIAGEWIHVGLPKAQAVLTEHERRALPAIFAGAGFDPTAPPSDQEFASALKRHGGQALRGRTLDLIADRSSEPELFGVLLDTVRGELEEWNGEAPADGESADYGTTAVARVCLRVDEVAGRVAATLRVAARADFPEDGLTLETPDGALRFTCREYLPGWSSPLRDEATGQDADAAAVTWSEGHVFTDGAEGWQVRLPRRRVRIFVRGLPMDLPGLVEVRRLLTSSPFYLAAAAATVPALERWVASGDVDLQRVAVHDGVPPGWTLFKSSGAIGDAAIRSALPELALPTTVRVRLDGGIRSGQGNTYFKFAPPMIAVEGVSGDDEVWCEDRRLAPAVEGASIFALPPDLSAGTRITVEVRRETVLRRQSLFLSDQFDWIRRTPEVGADEFGVVREWRGGETQIAGAFGGAEDGDDFPISPALSSGRRVFIVGRRPGEIRSFPAQGLPEDWQPVWLIELGRRGRAEYCGVDLASSRPVVDAAGAADDRAQWRHVLWHRRKRIQPPEHPRLRELWGEYVEVAAHV